KTLSKILAYGTNLVCLTTEDNFHPQRREATTRIIVILWTICSGRTLQTIPLSTPPPSACFLVSNTGAPHYSHFFCLSWR
ncbi:hypothetical protein, partial [Enterobacter asburiae]|uniref:hypothetical protein n=1 Tax=Enterobacter asburiae TaxID=61645 RepID=UPI002446837A